MWLLWSLLLALFIFLGREEKFFPAKEAASFMNKNEGFLLFFILFFRKMEKKAFPFDFLTWK